MAYQLLGTVHWAKVLGAPQPGYKNQFKHWSFDLSLDESGLKEAANLGINDRVKRKGKEHDPFITFSRKEFKKDTQIANQPIPVIDEFGQPWSKDEKGLIGNGSQVRVVFNTYDIPDGGKGVTPLSLQVLKHVPFSVQVENPDAQPTAEPEKWTD